MSTAIDTPKSRRTVYRLSAIAHAAIAPLVLEHGYSPKVVARGLARMRVIDGLYPMGVWDWRRLFLFFARQNRVAGITLGHHVFLASEHLLANRALLAHEAVHVVQVEQRSLLIFLLRYGGEWLLLRLKGTPSHEAYLALRDEVEARSVEHALTQRGVGSAPWLEATGE